MMHVCPNCGYCPHCGRGGYPMYPAPVYPQPIWITPQPTWTITTGNLGIAQPNTTIIWDANTNGTLGQ